MSPLKICFAAGVFAAVSVPAAAATLTSYVSKEGKVIVILNGEIASGDADQLTQLTKSANDSGKIVSGIRLNSPGGNLLEGVKLSELIRFAKIATVVPNGSTCASACFVAFAAGADKFASYSASVGVHGASDKNGRETEQGNAATVAMAKVVKELGVPAEIIGRMVVTPPDQIVWLSPNNLRAMGTTMTGKPVQTPSANAAQVAAPAQVPVQPPAQTEQQKWENIVKWATDLSIAQHNGKPSFVRSCQPELKICTTAIWFTSNDGKDMMVRRADDADGNLLSRDVCEFNPYGDIRTCVDWDKGTTHRDMKGSNGSWTQIEAH